MKVVAYYLKKAWKVEEISSFQVCEHQIAGEWNQKTFDVTELQICGDLQLKKAVELLPQLH